MTLTREQQKVARILYDCARLERRKRLLKAAIAAIAILALLIPVALFLQA